jgi:hypothetical protein
MSGRAKAKHEDQGGASDDPTDARSEGDAPPLAEPVPPPAEPTGQDDISGAPRDSSIIVLIFPDGSEAEAYWRQTRRHVKGRWEPIAFWADPLTNFVIAGEPIGWRPRFPTAAA